jgi:hypothetical protein
MDFKKINTDISELISNGIVNPDIGTAEKAVPVKIKSVSLHAVKMAEKRNITLEDAQRYIDTANVMFRQIGRQNSERLMYLFFNLNRIGNFSAKAHSKRK